MRSGAPGTAVGTTSAALTLRPRSALTAPDPQSVSTAPRAAGRRCPARLGVRSGGAAAPGGRSALWVPGVHTGSAASHSGGLWESRVWQLRAAFPLPRQVPLGSGVPGRELA